MKNLFSKIISRAMVEKKKTAMALCLVVVMAVMWIRAFGGKTPTGAEAVVLSPQAPSSQSNPKTEVSFLDLPYVKGRNDVLNRDFFTVKGFSLTAGNAKTNDDSDEHIKSVIENLKLDASGIGRIPQVFINGKVYTIGDELTFEDNGGIYKFEIVRIEKESVLIKYGQSKVELRFKQ
jgi:hypothetical protein